MEPDPLASAPRRVEAYLDQILAPLTRRLSPFHREEMRRELREHLWARVDAYRELGHSEEEAVTEALRQFGGAEDFLRQWRREWMRAPRQLPFRDVYEAGRQALRPSLAGLAATILPYIVLERCPQWLYGSLAFHWLSRYGMPLFWVYTAFALVGLPTLVGARQGRHRPAQAGAGMMAALTAEVVVTSLLYRFVAWDAPDTAPRQVVFVTSFMALTAWLLVAPGAAAVSSWWARRPETRRLA